MSQEAQRTNKRKKGTVQMTCGGMEMSKRAVNVLKVLFNTVLESERRPEE